MRDAHTGQWQQRWMERVQMRNKIARNLGTWDGFKSYQDLLQEYGNVLAIPRHPVTSGGMWYAPKKQDH
ncbi:hypothetical protein HNQ50_001474 [Silvimonas terrae]|uniref:Uncharacterized protein n=1 Tax=Silvimonas terrae TaxID=300266 RepID=A0A840REM3_9NEIS|nr:hypothetical protein [Silvimonas terrae]MBB5190752.1 hypothetical protein [Silvimonas terrae]